MTTRVDIEAFIKSLEEEYIPRARQAAKRAIEGFAEAIIGEAVQLCPQSSNQQYIASPKTGAKIQNPLWNGHSGALRDSAIVEDAVVEGENVSILVGFNTHYAAAVHEILTNFHPVGQAKYLEQPMNTMGPKLPDYVLAQLQKEFGS